MTTDPEAVLSDLRNFWTQTLSDPEIAGNIVGLAPPGFALTRAERPDEAAGHSRFGGRAMLEPGTRWPHCDDFPLSLLAVLDTDALPPSWLDGLLPAGTGLLNFFYLDADSEQHDPLVVDPLNKCIYCDPEAGRVIPASSAYAVETEPPDRASVFNPVPWMANPGYCLPGPLRAGWDGVGLEEDVLPIGLAIHHGHFTEWARRPGSISSVDFAFGWHDEMNPPLLPPGEHLDDYQHLLQLGNQDDWWIGGDGGEMQWSIPRDALRAGDFTQAIPTPALS